MRAALPVRRIEADPLAVAPPDVWPATLPAVRQVLTDGLELGPVTVITGENGSGKSTLVEALAIAYGLNAEGGSTGAQHASRPSESSLGEHLRVVRGAGASKKGFFLRAETMHAFYSYLERSEFPERLHERSHGESFLDLVSDRWRLRGLWLLDEPEAALSLSGCLALVALLREQVAAGSQVVVSTHSPVIAAFPGADLIEVGEWGLRSCDYDDLDLVRGWRGFLAAPERYVGGDGDA
ncbi:AAA family ATPase [Litorihabitans aurantiacus]|uniref:ABC transporter, ATP-binding protein n=1 Tax=Litorihabitans aurantiacus TaxID=1930061 RepID=A0AA37XFY8_9MICO|nr:AAA family ATPase [Litorihabitans aurantiacus]GMA32626.1 ABC transporter, ATP-binding protein [Litorihabitans aurantiacus]